MHQLGFYKHKQKYIFIEGPTKAEGIIWIRPPPKRAPPVCENGPERLGGTKVGRRLVYWGNTYLYVHNYVHCTMHSWAHVR